MAGTGIVRDFAELVCTAKRLLTSVEIPLAVLTGMHVLQGFVYVVDCEGRTLEGWPLQMGEVQAQVAVGDINGDGALEVVAVDTRGNVAALSPDGTELWERHLKSAISQVVPERLMAPSPVQVVLHMTHVLMSGCVQHWA